jgi:hypothetical protein
VALKDAADFVEQAPPGPVTPHAAGYAANDRTDGAADRCSHNRHDRPNCRASYAAGLRADQGTAPPTSDPRRRPASISTDFVAILVKSQP